MSECYVCLEATDEKSPCECEIPLHKRCYMELHDKMSPKACSICKRPFHFHVSRRQGVACATIILFIVLIAIIFWLLNRL